MVTALHPPKMHWQGELRRIPLEAGIAGLGPWIDIIPCNQICGWGAIAAEHPAKAFFFGLGSNSYASREKVSPQVLLPE